MYEGERFNSWTHLLGMVLAPASAAVLIARGVPLSSLQVHPPTLEDLFIKLTGHALRG